MNKKTTTIKIDYNDNSCNLCCGKLIVTINDKIWEFPKHCLSSGGSVSFDDDGNDYTTIGDWSICAWPAGFPEELKQSVEDAVNIEIEHGCCGYCV